MAARGHMRLSNRGNGHLVHRTAPPLVIAADARRQGIWRAVRWRFLVDLYAVVAPQIVPSAQDRRVDAPHTWLLTLGRPALCVIRPVPDAVIPKHHPGLEVHQTRGPPTGIIWLLIDVGNGAAASRFSAEYQPVVPG